jgi:hypothetical protein
MAKLNWGDENPATPGMAAADAAGAVQRSAEQGWTPDVAREIVNKVAQITTQQSGLVSAQDQRAAMMAGFRAADRGGVVPPTPAEVAGAGGGGGAGAGGIPAAAGGAIAGGGVAAIAAGGLLGKLAMPWAHVGDVVDSVSSGAGWYPSGFLDRVNSPGRAGIGRNESVWQGMEGSNLAQFSAQGKLDREERRITNAADQAAGGDFDPIDWAKPFRRANERGSKAVAELARRLLSSNGPVDFGSKAP